MTRPTFALLAFFLLAGCNVTAAEIECCAELCAGNGGVNAIEPAPITRACWCENGARFSDWRIDRCVQKQGQP